MVTKRLYLREITVEDIDRMYEIYGGEGITDYMEGLYENPDDEREFTKEYINNMYRFYEYGIWVICLKENDEIIGRAGLSNREVDGENKLELGYVVGTPYQRQYYAYEACQAICEYAKNKLYMSELVCFIESGNYSSIKLAEKLGFKYIQDITIKENSAEKIYAYYEKKMNS